MIPLIDLTPRVINDMSIDELKEAAINAMWRLNGLNDDSIEALASFLLERLAKRDMRAFNDVFNATKDFRPHR